MPRCSLRILSSILVGVMLHSTVQAARAEDPLVFVSAFTSGDKAAIHAYTLQPDTGRLKPLHRTTDVQNPFFMAVSRDHRFLYSIHALSFGSQAPEQVAAFALEGRTGRLKLLNRQSTHGSASCYVDVDQTGKTVLVANYTTGNVASFPVQSDGSLAPAASIIQHVGSSVDLPRQKGPNAHSIVISPDNRFAYAADLGIDQILGYRLDVAGGKIAPNRQPFVRTPPGAGPRHLTFHPNGKHLYAINEIKNSVTLFDFIPESGFLIERQTISTLPADFKGQSYCADLKITPDGRFLYGTNRGHDSIAAYRIDADGTLTLLGIEPSLGKGPQNLAIAAGGKLLLCANLPADNIVVFRIDPETGNLKPAGEPLTQPSPSCIMVIP